MAKRKRVRRGGAARKNALFIVCAALGFLVAALPTVIVLCIGMIPTAVAYIVDMTPGRYATRCVAGLNIAGVVPFLDRLWASSNDVYSAVGIVTDVFAWLAFYVASGIGWLLFMSLPGIVASLKTYNATRRAHALRERLVELEHEWGRDVTGQPVEAADKPDPAAPADLGAEQAQPV